MNRLLSLFFALLLVRTAVAASRWASPASRV